ncbi:peptidase domain-containing ABC transporter [Vibrio cholerae]|uniref:peptidase domain-containing ABC transporter n=1 Tax=Vibrio cholerae TaxID=666 RepID=UPI001156D45A|nr:peptidase domain-containing ABC transporter [Vibrio cholerae]EKF9231135.1 peptidase domain-containing ABC transporter [Vibrio cholerae]MDY7587609.1 peptidase domain-containing ABC transporter [Vibrio cholerae]TQP03875.1 peptidase domain-containing ABC transporter [Vibrio cholerae]
MNSSDFAINVSKLLEFGRIKKVPTILQSEVDECGISCLAMVSSYYGNKINLPPLRRDSNFSNEGMKLIEVMNVANSLNLTSRALQCSLDDTAKLKLPCILHWELNHYVVLTDIIKGNYYINDPAIGRRILTTKQFSDSFTGIALELTPNSEFKTSDSRVVMGIGQLWNKLLGIKRSLFSLFILTIILQFFALLSPYYMQWVIDHVLLSHDMPLLAILALGFSLLKVIQIIVSSFRTWLIIRISSSLNIQMGANLFNHLLRLPISFFEKRHVGDIVSRFGSLNVIKQMISTGFVEGLIDGIMAIIVLIMMYIYSPILANLVVVIVFIYFLIQCFFYNPTRTIEEELINSEAKEDSIFLESVRGIQSLKLFTLEATRLNTWLNQYADVINVNIRKSKIGIFQNILTSLLFGLESILIVYIGAVTVMDGKLTVGMLLAFIAYKSHFISSISSFIGKCIAFKMLSLHLERLSDIALENEETKISSINSDFFGKSNGFLRVENLGFRYSEKSDWVFNGVSFEISPGECLAITGVSGCGKTTLMKVILGLLKPTEGKIYLDGVESSQWPLDLYRKKFSAVMQKDTLFSGTLIENITMFEQDYDENRLVDCCRMACILDDIRALPMGFRSLVGDMGSSFSGGQLQRVYLARALYRNPLILCLDESTSHLDMSNESLINENLKDTFFTKIIIAHREETISTADKIYRLDKI